MLPDLQSARVHACVCTCVFPFACATMPTRRAATGGGHAKQHRDTPPTTQTPQGESAARHHRQTGAASTDSCGCAWALPPAAEECRPAAARARTQHTASSFTLEERGVAEEWQHTQPKSDAREVPCHICRPTCNGTCSVSTGTGPEVITAVLACAIASWAFVRTSNSSRPRATPAIRRPWTLSVPAIHVLSCAWRCWDESDEANDAAAGIKRSKNP